jgi:hypothetical protein
MGRLLVGEVWLGKVPMGCRGVKRKVTFCLHSLTFPPTRTNKKKIR